MGTHPIRFGIQTGQQSLAWAELLALWQKADAWGYDSLWNFDHFYPIFVDPEGPCLESWTTLAALAQATRRARIGTMVSGNTYRHPCVTAKMAATLDHVSGGRFNLGLGAGWFEREHRDFGIDFKTVPRRLEALEEALQIIRGMLTEPRTTLHGRHYTVTDAIGLPKPVQQPHPPIMIGGTGQKVLLRIVAQYADMWNASAGGSRGGGRPAGTRVCRWPWGGGRDPGLGGGADGGGGGGGGGGRRGGGRGGRRGGLKLSAGHADTPASSHGALREGSRARAA